MINTFITIDEDSLSTEDLVRVLQDRGLYACPRPVHLDLLTIYTLHKNQPDMLCEHVKKYLEMLGLNTDVISQETTN